MSGWFLVILSMHVAGAAAALALGRNRVGAAAVSTLPLAAMVVWAGIAAATGVLDGEPVVASIDWIPALGVSFDLSIDGLSLVFLLLVSGVGIGIVVFSGGYMKKDAISGRFFALLVLFAGAMSGLVATDNVFGLFVFWELTTITSYLLVGYEDQKGSARAAALQAVLTTGIGGLALLGGLVLLSQAAGTASLTAIVATPPDGGVTAVALVLVLLGAFTKSAQAPFHFWLPGAMAAPTPASAYLHSATMVKAGIFLLIKLAPGFSAQPLWTPVVLTVGLTTMVVGAWRALRQTDLKLLLAYGTVSQLGMMTALAGVGTAPLLNATVAVVVGHALFKSALFLTVGTVDSAAGTRDIRMLSGLGVRLPGLALAAGLAAASMAGVAPLAGFVAKEAAFAALIDEAQWVALAVVAAASVLTVAYSIRFWTGAFGKKPIPPEADVHGHAAGSPGVWLSVPTIILAWAGLAAGAFPSLMDRLVSAAAPGGKLVLWPGWKPALAVSIAVVIAGVAAHAGRATIASAQHRFEHLLESMSVPTGDGGYRLVVSGLNRVADRVTGIVQNGSLPIYLAVILVVVVGAPASAWVASAGGPPGVTWAYSTAELVLGALLVLTAVAVARATGRLVAVLLLGAVGYAMAGVFVVYGAPDLALTLLLVETITVAIFAFVLLRLPRRFEVRTWRVTRAIRLTVAFAVGGFVAAAMLVASAQRTATPVGAEYPALAPDAGGTNVVNVILTDFRALDTLGEITVVAVAAIGVAALVTGLRTREGESA